jgi:hypothetical protein
VSCESRDGPRLSTLDYGVTVRLADRPVPFKTPETVTEDVVETATVVTVKLAAAAPASTLTLAGTVAIATLELLNVTTTPPEGARPVKVTVAVDALPPLTVDGARVRVARSGRLTVTLLLAVAPRYEAVRVTAVDTATGVVGSVNVPVTVPWGIVTLGGTERAAT